MDLRTISFSLLIYNIMICFDKWNVFEGSIRFHRFALRVFNNLRNNAFYKGRVRKMIQKRKTIIKKIVFKEFKQVYKSNFVEAVKLSEAERLNHTIRSQLIEKTVRTKREIDEIRLKLGKDDEEDELVDYEERRINKMKNLNLIDADDDKYLEEQKQKRLEKERERELKMLRSGYIPPDLLLWDREDRERELDVAEKVLIFSKSTKEKTLRIASQSDKLSQIREDFLNKKIAVLEELLASESEITSNAVTMQREYFDNFIVHAADNLVTILARIYVEVQKLLIKGEAKKYFRSLRMPMIISRSRSLYYRKKMINWIRICRRLIIISKRAPFYQRKRYCIVTCERKIIFVINIYILL